MDVGEVVGLEAIMYPQSPTRITNWWMVTWCSTSGTPADPGLGCLVFGRSSCGGARPQRRTFPMPGWLQGCSCWLLWFCAVDESIATLGVQDVDLSQHAAGRLPATRPRFNRLVLPRNVKKKHRLRASGGGEGNHRHASDYANQRSGITVEERW